ncbi:hypothetical protein NL676_027626 [Syzygium grande]|nr:hypothetical protein NL676_027626 [Syzygium grande]
MSSHVLSCSPCSYVAIQLPPTIFDLRSTSSLILSGLGRENPHEVKNEWELCNDDGFIYKRKKWRLYPSAMVPPPPPSLPDPHVEETVGGNARERRF